jgi:3'-5' exonuclease
MTAPGLPSSYRPTRCAEAIPGKENSFGRGRHLHAPSFDLPVLRYRAMVNGVAAPGLSLRPYFNRYTEDAVDLCDVLSSFSSQAKATLHELCRVMGLPGKPDGISGSEVEKYYRDGRIREIAEYCEGDVVNTYRVWLRYELFRGRLSDAAFEASEMNLEFIKARGLRSIT